MIVSLSVCKRDIYDYYYAISGYHINELWNVNSTSHERTRKSRATSRTR
jgi:hypothetical protein